MTQLEYSINTTSEQPAAAFSGFEQADFDVFAIAGLAPRMEALIRLVRPKLTALGQRLSPALSLMTGTEMHPHVAKHARRTVNPPSDTWVAFAPSRRGYKALPHFQVGMYQSHLFVQFALIYEATSKSVFASRALAQLPRLRRSIPPHYVWSGNHMVPGGTAHSRLSKAELTALLARLQTVNAAELLCGIEIDRHDPLLSDGERLLQQIEATFETVLPLYRLAQS